MNRIIFTICMVMMLFGNTAQAEDNIPINKPLWLADGTYVFVSYDGTMRMPDRDGKQARMEKMFSDETGRRDGSYPEKQEDQAYYKWLP